MFVVLCIKVNVTGLCEVVMLGDDIPKALKQNGSVHCYPGNDDNDDEDLNMAESYEIQMGNS